MKTIALLSFVLCLPACTADVFSQTGDQPGDDAGPTLDAAMTVDSTPDALTVDSTPDMDGSSEASPTKDATPDVAVVDATPDAKSPDAGQEPMCAPLGYKACAQPFSKCKVTASDGTATCVVPGVTPHQSGCLKDDDCGNDEICDGSLCRKLCEKTYQTPWGTNSNIWSTANCAACPTGQNYQSARLPSWLGVCIF